MAETSVENEMEKFMEGHEHIHVVWPFMMTRGGEE